VGVSTEGHSLSQSLCFGKHLKGWVVDTKTKNEVSRVGGLAPRNYGGLLGRSTVKVRENRL
jgi:hypothetical protein